MIDHIDIEPSELSCSDFQVPTMFPSVLVHPITAMIDSSINFFISEHLHAAHNLIYPYHLFLFDGLFWVLLVVRDKRQS